MLTSVIICTYNPVKEIFNQVLESLKHQTLPLDCWELIIVDNASIQPVKANYDTSWHPNTTIIVEQQPGLTHARITGVTNAAGSLMVFIDDDNIADKFYLERSKLFFESHPEVGCFGGRSLPIFSIKPPEWFKSVGINLGCQDYGERMYISNYKQCAFQIKEYPNRAPIGTGMVIQKEAFLGYVEDVYTEPKRLLLGRNGNQLTSGEDNDIILTIVRKGYEIAYVPELLISHYISQERLTKKYLAKMAYQSNRSWVKVLQYHNISPWSKISPMSLLPRKLKSYLLHKAWSAADNYINWKGACGIFDGLSEN